MKTTGMEGGRFRLCRPGIPSDDFVRDLFARLPCRGDPELTRRIEEQLVSGLCVLALDGGGSCRDGAAQFLRGLFELPPRSPDSPGYLGNLLRPPEEDHHEYHTDYDQFERVQGHRMSAVIDFSFI